MANDGWTRDARETVRIDTFCPQIDPPSPDGEKCEFCLAQGDILAHIDGEDRLLCVECCNARYCDRCDVSRSECGCPLNTTYVSSFDEEESRPTIPLYPDVEDEWLQAV